MDRRMCDMSAEELKKFYKETTGKDLRDEQINMLREDMVCPGIEFEKSGTHQRDLKEVIEDLLQSVKEEHEAQINYMKRAAIASIAGDSKMAELYQHIKDEEVQHEQELSRHFYEEYK